MGNWLKELGMQMRMKDSLVFLSEIVTLVQCIDLQLNSVEGGAAHTS